MVLVKIALYIFIFTLIMYLAYRALWLIFFLFNFRFWEIVIEKYFPHFAGNLQPFHKIMLLTFIAFISYLFLYTLTMKMPIIRYILLAVLFVVAIREYSITDILFFKDYLKNNGMWGMDYWYEQIRKLFSLKEGDIITSFNEVLDNFVNFFLNIVKEIKKL
ncbi:hypothetical protein U8V72_11110 [Priestia filamentosa]|uniref:hypothetical protein n=1 Tax=Priestia filamentosa TaxID=1402861 RepID=UPI00397D2BF6